jgi:hypothetical protein
MPHDVFGLAASALAQGQPSSDPNFDPTIFKTPPAKYRGHAMWNFNLVTLNEKDVIGGIQEMARLNFGGFFIEAGGRPQPGQGVPFLSDEYSCFYKIAIEEAKKQGLEMILYDDYAFPTGAVGGQMLAKYPLYGLSKKRLILFGESSVRRAAAEFPVHYHRERNH